MAGRGKKFIDAADVVRKQDGRIDLFNTILARKDPEAQIPALVSGASIASPRSPKVSPSLESNAPLSVSVDQGTSRSSQSPPAEGETVAPVHRPQENLGSKRSLDVPGDRKTVAPAHRIQGGQELKNKSVPTSPPQGSPGSKRNTQFPPDKGETMTPANHSQRNQGPSILTLFTRYADNPALIPAKNAYWHDKNHVIIKDAYPKAKVHMLVIPRTKVDKPSHLSGDTGLNILLELQERADWLLNRLKTETPDMPFLEYKMGFHIVPSLVQLHLHVISQDFCSASLKNKKHWNSFTTSFFVELSAAIEKIKKDKTLALTSGEEKSFEDELKRPLECNQCSVRPSNFPALKKHLEQHFDQRAKAWRESQK